MKKLATNKRGIYSCYYAYKVLTLRFIDHEKTKNRSCCLGKIKLSFSYSTLSN